MGRLGIYIMLGYLALGLIFALAQDIYKGVKGKPKHKARKKRKQKR